MKKYILLIIFLAVYYDSQSQIFQDIRSKGFYVALASGYVKDPILGGDWDENETEFVLDLSQNCINARAGLEYLEEKWGIGIGLSYWFNEEFDKVVPTDMPFKNLNYQAWYIDLTLHWIPLYYKKVGFGFYGVIGFGSKYSSYSFDYSSSINELEYDQWVFTPSYGLGSRIYFTKWLSLFIEYRWVQGIDFSQQEGSKWSVSGIPSSYQKVSHFSKEFSFGLMVTF